MTDDVKNIDEGQDELPEKKELNSGEEITPSETEGTESIKEESKPELPPEEEIIPVTEPSEPIEKEEPVKEEIIPPIPEFPKESNYQVSLINENLLRIRVSTLKSVNIDCTVKDRTTPEGDASELQTNKIQIHPKHDNQPQEVEIIISIDPDSGNIVVEKKKIIR